MRGKIEALFANVVSSVRPKLFHDHETDIGSDVAFALQYSYDNIIGSQNFSESDQVLDFLDPVLDYVWERLNVGHWKDVPDCLRDVYAYASLLKAITLLKSAAHDNEENTMQNLIDTVETVDRGLLLGCSCREELCLFASSLCSLLRSNSRKFPYRHFNQFEIDQTERVIIPNPKVLVTKECPSIESFLRDHFQPHSPVKLTGCMNHWPALKKWNSVDYIIEKIGPRLVPVEIGSSYTSSSWSQKLMTVEKFIEKFFFSDTKDQIGYLAQHQLFNQIPELLQDICEPDYCVLSENYNDNTGTDVNAWFGPANTVSPLHYDPKHNFLAQVVGSKRIFLIDPAWSKNVYPYDDFLLFNTAQVDLENIDNDKFPDFSVVEIYECLLNAGEMLYIPPKWWHHVRALSNSFSVSFWWGND